MDKRKKIGVITYWESNDNYGQQLQCWALQHYLRERGYDAFLIRQYAWPEQWSPKKKGLKRIKQWIKDTLAAFLYATNLAYQPSIFKRFSFCLDKEAYRRRFPIFRKENMKMTKIYDTPDKLMNKPPKANVYITGSDQVWNYWLNEEPLKNYFLQFGRKYVKRIAYAPSIGHTTLPDEYKHTYHLYLKKFSAISVREKSTVPIIQSLGYKVQCVLDPSMLLNTEEYLLLSQNVKTNPNVFIYSMNYESVEDIPFEAIKHYAKSNGLPIIVTPGSGYVSAKELFTGVEYSYATIPEWIQNIANSELVITASFHGIVFSILFHRRFIYTPLNGEHSESNNRVFDLLEALGLDSRVWDEKITFDDYTTENIKWLQVDERLNNMRKQSLDFLLTAIND